MDVSLCADGHKCHNGSECVKKTDSRYGCDCSTAYDVSAFAGHMCEHPATSYCEFGTSVSFKSFCSNNGVCKDYVVAGEDGKLEHPGCYCQSGFEGDHCQYLLGEAPKGYTTSEESPMYTGSSAYDIPFPQDAASHLVGFSIVVIYFTMLVFVCLAMCFTGCMKRRPMTADDIDDELDPDGEELKKSIEEMRKTKAAATTTTSKDDKTTAATTGDVEMVDMKDADISVGKKSPSIQKLKTTKSKVKSKASDEIGVVLDPDGKKLKDSMAAEGHDVENIDL